MYLFYFEKQLRKSTSFYLKSFKLDSRDSSKEDAELDKINDSNSVVFNQFQIRT